MNFYKLNTKRAMFCGGFMFYLKDSTENAFTLPTTREFSEHFTFTHVFTLESCSVQPQPSAVGHSAAPVEQLAVQLCGQGHIVRHPFQELL